MQKTLLSKITLKGYLSFMSIMLLALGSKAFDTETIQRGLVAVQSNNQVYLSWRLLSSDTDSLGFNVYRISNGTSTQLNLSPIKASTNFTDTTVDLSATNTYFITTVINGNDSEYSDTVAVWENNYLTIPLQTPDGGTNASGTYTYTGNDASVGDLDGDGDYEIILKWDPTNSKDNSLSGYTGNVYLDAYEMDGTFLWRIDLGVNIRAGAHYTQFMVYDLDQDGKAEIACKTAPGTKDGTGAYLSQGTAASADHTADYRNSSGYILSGPEYLTVFNGQTGKEITTVDYTPARGTVSSWGDSYGNRVDRFLACVAYLDGEKPSLVMCRGYYTRTVLSAWDFDGTNLTQKWIFDSNNGYSDYAGQGNHQLSVADVDEDGADEIIYGSMAVDNDGTGLWNAGFGHGDAMHVSDILPERPGLEKWGVYEESNQPGGALLDARTGEVIFALPITSEDVGRGVAADLTPDSYGMECWGGTDGLVNGYNERVGSKPSSTNHVVWWDGDLCRELLNDITIKKYSGGTLLQATGCHSNNSTKANPSLQADLFGDWREEVIWPTDDNTALRIYTTTIPTEYRIPTLMQDHVYRMGIVWQNVAYNQPPHTGYYLGDGMFNPDSLRAPSKPRSVSADAESATIVLSWNDIFDTDLAGYQVYRSTSSNGTYEKINSDLVNDNTFTDTTLTLDMLYYYYITAIDTFNNESDPSEIVQASATLKPDCPENVRGTYGNQSAFVYWDPVLTTTISGYNVYQSVSSTTDGFSKINTSLIEDTEYSISGLSNNTTYYFAVTAVDQSDEESFYSEAVTIIPKTKVILQAEDAVIVSAEVETEHTGYNGTGYVNFAASSSSVTFYGVYADTIGSYYLLYRYALGKDARTGSLTVNDNTLSCVMNNTEAFTTYVYDSIAVQMNSGFDNVITFATTGSDFGNFDEIQMGSAVSEIVDNVNEKQFNPLSIEIAPNPMGESANIHLTGLEDGFYNVIIYNVLGQPVTCINVKNTSENQTISWNGTDSNGRILVNGIYFINLYKDKQLLGSERIVVNR